VRAIVGGDPGGHAFGRIDSFAESGSKASRVDRGHRLQIETRTKLCVKSEADQATSVRGHEVDRFGSDVLGGNREIAFVLTIFVVNDDQDLTLAEILDCFRYRGERHSN